jgi:very-short-patch-repair endonuclease
MPKGELILWGALRNRTCGYKFRRQYGIGPFIIDLYCPQVNLAVEVDGLSHIYEEQKQYDKRRQVYLESKRIHVIRFESGDVFFNLDRVLQTIYDTCKHLEKNKT